MLLSEYDELAHIENEKKISEEEGIEKGLRKGLRKGRKKGVKEGEELMVELVTCLKKDGRLNELDLIKDEKARQRLYKEYHLKD